jgi:hypothetical protein
MAIRKITLLLRNPQTLGHLEPIFLTVTHNYFWMAYGSMLFLSRHLGADGDREGEH